MSNETLTILLIGDNPANVRRIRKKLVCYASAICVYVVENLADARKYLGQAHPDLAIADQNLPDGSGHDLLADGWPLPIIILTGHDGNLGSEEDFFPGDGEHLVKGDKVLEELPRLLLEIHQRQQFLKKELSREAYPEKEEIFLQKFVGGLPRRFWSSGASITLCR